MGEETEESGTTEQCLVITIFIAAVAEDNM